MNLSLFIQVNTKCNLKCLPEVFKAIGDSLNPTEDKTTVLQCLKKFVWPCHLNNMDLAVPPVTIRMLNGIKHVYLKKVFD